MQSSSLQLAFDRSDNMHKVFLTPRASRHRHVVFFMSLQNCVSYGFVNAGTNGRNSRRASVRTGGPGNDGGLGAALSGLSPGPRPSGFAGTVVD